MNGLQRAGIALLVCGALVFLAPSGAFSSTVAERGTTVQTASDANALVGIEYPAAEDGTRTVQLESGQADEGGGCFFVCSDYEYNNIGITLFTDQTGASNLAVDQIEVSNTNGDMIGGEGLREEQPENGMQAIRGDFRCSSSGIFGSGDQQHDSTNITVSLEASNQNLTVSLDREITVECVQD
ncbi:hypothetical protein [Halostella litorea]|uniref:hypothetical protein n=1 Tax=Halostella litorea TaxID=2528831 RepID=UPI0010920FE7|nr:hypothetical protein [Halostella litorea]